MIIATRSCDNSQKRCEFSWTLFILYKIVNKLFTKTLFGYNFSKNNFGKVVLLASVPNFCKIDFCKMKT